MKHPEKFLGNLILAVCIAAAGFFAGRKSVGNTIKNESATLRDDYIAAISRVIEEDGEAAVVRSLYEQMESDSRILPSDRLQVIDFITNAANNPNTNSTSGYRAMGTAALSDARSILSIAISHNMDNVNPITQDDLAKYMGLTKDKDGKADAANTPAVCDASGSKQIIANVDGTIIYNYRRDDVTLRATINTVTQAITWEVFGVTDNGSRHVALREGLRLAADDDLNVSTTDLWAT